MEDAPMSVPTMHRVAAAAAAGSAILYFLIGFGMIEVGRSTSGENDIFAFGMTVGAVFVVAAVIVLWTSRRWLLGIVGAVDLMVIIGYFVLAGVREPPFEPNGLLIKGLQVIMLAAIIGLLLHRRREPEHVGGHPKNVLSWSGTSSR
jgi:hypothetical protein